MLLSLQVPNTSLSAKFVYQSDVITNSGRVYEFDCGSYLSVTTLLSRSADKDWLVKWRERIGEEKAARITQKSTIRGSIMHDHLEQLVLGKTLNTLRIMPTAVAQCIGMHKVLVQNLTHSYGVEVPVCHPEWKTAGRIDLIGQWTGVDSIIDYKTSIRDKNEEDIQDYFLQATAYAECARETLGFDAKQIVILIACDSGKVLQFVRNPLQYKDESHYRITHAQEKDHPGGP